MIEDFIKRVYTRGLYAIIRDYSGRGMSGQFGATTLASWEMAGRIMLTFERAGATVTFLADASEPSGRSMGLHTQESTDKQARAMISEVVAHWPDTYVGRIAVYRGDDDVRLKTNMGIFP